MTRPTKLLVAKAAVGVPCLALVSWGLFREPAFVVGLFAFLGVVGAVGWGLTVLFDPYADGEDE